MKKIKSIENSVTNGDSVNVLKTIPNTSVNLVYLDPPFFTQKTHSLRSRENGEEYSFDDKFSSLDEYLNFIEQTLIECKRVLKKDGSIFLHCDKTASHYLRIILDKVFGTDNFRNEIIWSYRRWSNSKKGLLNSHQVIFFYSITDKYKFNAIYTDYSPTTNLDQILQERERNELGVSVYKKDENGVPIQVKSKQGVPLSDVWEIPFLNPKAKERTGYPTQKPVLLLNQIIKIASNEGDIVLDPFCGSGTTCVSAKKMNRKYIGIDISAKAIELTNKRLQEMTISSSKLVENGKHSYIEKTQEEINILSEINAFPVQRNSAIDGFLKESLTPVKILKDSTNIDEIISKLNTFCIKGKHDHLIIVQASFLPQNILNKILVNYTLIKSLAYQLQGEKRVSKAQ